MKKITKISTQKQAGRYSVELDQVYAFGVAESVLIKYGLAKGRELDDALIAKIKYDDAIAKALNTALNYLGHALRTEKQIREKLKEKAIADPIQDEVLVRLKTLGYVDDLNYAKHYVATKKRLSPKGPLAVGMALQQAGVSESAIAQALTTYTRDEQLAVGEKIAVKLSQRYQREATRAKQQKIVQALAQKGFAFDIAQSIVSRLDLANDGATEHANITRQAEKLWHRYRNESQKTRLFKIKSKLYTKGFSAELIEAVLPQLETAAEYAE